VGSAPSPGFHFSSAKLSPQSKTSGLLGTPVDQESMHQVSVFYYISSPHFWATCTMVKAVNSFWQNIDWATFWAIFSLTHLVTLAVACPPPPLKVFICTYIQETKWWNLVLISSAFWSFLGVTQTQSQRLPTSGLTGKANLADRMDSWPGSAPPWPDLESRRARWQPGPGKGRIGPPPGNTNFAFVFVGSNPRQEVRWQCCCLNLKCFVIVRIWEKVFKCLTMYSLCCTEYQMFVFQRGLAEDKTAYDSCIRM
jgi:hypothetical protein